MIAHLCGNTGSQFAQPKITRSGVTVADPNTSLALTNTDVLVANFPDVVDNYTETTGNYQAKGAYTYTVAYQWFVNDTKTTVGATGIASNGGGTATLTLSGTTVNGGTTTITGKYIYCRVQVTRNKDASPVITDSFNSPFTGAVA